MRACSVSLENYTVQLFFCVVIFFQIKTQEIALLSKVILSYMYFPPFTAEIKARNIATDFKLHDYTTAICPIF